MDVVRFPTFSTVPNADMRCSIWGATLCRIEGDQRYSTSLTKRCRPKSMRIPSGFHRELGRALNRCLRYLMHPSHWTVASLRGPFTYCCRMIGGYAEPREPKSRTDRKPRD